jgi:CO/xanthine dehydrogenase Mo-binding subunit
MTNISERGQGGSWIGASVLRKEDARHLHGHGMLIADINVPATQEIAFVRSQRAHANVRRVTKPQEPAGHIFTLAEIGPIKAGRAPYWHCRRSVSKSRVASSFRSWGHRAAAKAHSSCLSPACTIEDLSGSR